jgi:hypothetical protein
VQWRALASRGMRSCFARIFHCSCAILAVGTAKIAPAGIFVHGNDRQLRRLTM